MSSVQGEQAIGSFGYAVGPTGSGASGAISVPAGAQVRTIYAHATTAGTIVIGTGNPSIPIPAASSFVEAIQGDKLMGPLTITGSGTDSLYVSWITAG